jgi:hypothetical protein
VSADAAYQIDAAAKVVGSIRELDNCDACGSPVTFNKLDLLDALACAGFKLATDVDGTASTAYLLGVSERTPGHSVKC